MSGETLLPCPFCGKPGKVMPIAQDSYTYVAVCSDYNAEPRCMGRMWMLGTKKRAIAAWNRRAPASSPSAAELAEPKTALDLIRKAPCAETGCGKTIEEHECPNLSEQRLAEVRAQAFEEAAVEAEKERTMFLTRQQIADGYLDDNHPIIKARAQMRAEVATALRALAAAARAGGKN